ncbi:MAG: hypothetical protein H6813_04015 [Phycisphaeraceae bacterium]|nr:hypothetical protein [Phycisphaeraceae bacterium]MCB9847112.1 hypothetical protein [Phycisphaeraceae bacterium]
MAGREQSNAVRAGVFLVASVVLAVVIIVMLSGIREKLRPANSYTVRFELRIGAQGLSEGSEVRVGGQKVGQVASVRFMPDGRDEIPMFVDVRIRIPRSLRLHEGAIARLEVPLLGSTSVLNFQSLGDPAAPMVNPGGMVPGRLAAPAFLASAGYGAEQANQLQHILTGMDDVVTRVNEGIVPDVEGVIGDVRARSGPWLDHIDAATADAREFIASLRSLVNDNRSSIDTTIANAEKISGTTDEVVTRVRDEMVDKALAMLDDGRSAAAQARETVGRVDSMLGEAAPDIRMSVANLRLTADQFKLASMEIRRAPWRLLYRPDTKELEYELLYDSARAYADAVSNLRGASASLESAASAGGAIDGQTIGDLSQRVSAAYSEYEFAEEKFLGLLLEKAKQ